MRTLDASAPDRPRNRGSIGSHLVALVVIQLILVWGLIGFAAVQDFKRARIDTEAQMSTTAKLAADFISTELETTYDSLAGLPGVIGSVAAADLCQLKDDFSAQSDRQFDLDAHMFHLDGSPVCADDARDPNVAREPWFADALASAEPVVRGPLVDPINSKHTMLYVVSIPDADMVVAHGVRLDSVGPALNKQFGLDRIPPSFLLASEDGSREVASSSGGTGRSLTNTGFVKPVSKNLNEFEDLSGVRRIYSDAIVSGTGWRLFAGVSTDHAFADAMRALRERVLFAVVILIMVLAAAGVLQRRFIRPIRSLVSATKRFRDGDPTSPVVAGGPTELNALGESFNEMMRVRAAAEAALERAVTAEQNANTELREIDSMRKAFIMAISHELRTPLTSVLGYASFLDERLGSLSQDELEVSVRAIVTQSKRLEKLLLDLLDVERLSRGVIQANRVDVDVRAMVRGVLDRSGAKRRIAVTTKSPVHAFVDPALTERVVENLVSNALKHSPSDTKIWVRAARRNGEFHLCVEDNGPGIPDEKKLAIFETFNRGAAPDHSPGTGVGLTLVAQFAKLQGGRAWVEDRKGGGAAFHVVLPADGPGPKPARSPRNRKSVAAA